MSSPLTVYYDGACPLCRREIAFYRRRVRSASVHFVDVSVWETSGPTADLDRCSALARLHVRLPDGGLVSGARAFTALWTRVPGFAGLGTILGRRPLVDLLELGYRAFLTVRPWLQRRLVAAG